MNKVNVIKQNLEFIGKTWMKCIGAFASILSIFFLFWTWDDIHITSTQHKCVIIILLCVLALILAILWTCILKRTKTIWESPSGKIKVCYSDIMKEGFDKRNKEEKLFVIPVNSCFDTIVDEDISSCSKPLVSPNSLHGRWIKAMVNNGFTIEDIDSKIHKCLEMQKLVPKRIISDEDFVYQHMNQNMQIKTGKCHSVPTVLENGKIELSEQWQWTSGDYSKGESLLVEV